MSVVLQHDSRVNVTYAYHNECIWDKASKKAGAKRTLIGRINPETGEIVPTSGTRRKNEINETLISTEIEEYNRKVHEKKQKASTNQTPEEKQIHQLSERYTELLSKYEDIKGILKSFAETIDRVVKD